MLSCCISWYQSLVGIPLIIEMLYLKRLNAFDEHMYDEYKETKSCNYNNTWIYLALSHSSGYDQQIITFSIELVLLKMINLLILILAQFFMKDIFEKINFHMILIVSGLELIIQVICLIWWFAWSLPIVILNMFQLYQFYGAISELNWNILNISLFGTTRGWVFILFFIFFREKINIATKYNIFDSMYFVYIKILFIII